MSLEQNCMYKKNKKKGMQHNGKTNDCPLFSVSIPSAPKKLTYSKFSETAKSVQKNLHCSENIGHDALHVEKKQDDSSGEDKIRNEVRDSFEKIPEGKNTSHMPTGNNSTVLIVDEYQGLRGSPGTPVETKTKKGSLNSESKRKESRDSEYETNDEVNSGGSHGSSLHSSRHNSKSKQSEDFKVKFRTELCKYYEIDGQCKFGENCAYAHGKDNLRTKVTKTSFYRTKKCKQFFELGFCPYGNRCQFAHAIKSNILNNPHDISLSYRKSMILLSRAEDLDQLKSHCNRPRLPIFKEISKQSENISKRKSEKTLSYIDDIIQLKNENDPIFSDHTDDINPRCRIFSL